MRRGGGGAAGRSMAPSSAAPTTRPSSIAAAPSHAAPIPNSSQADALRVVNNYLAPANIHLRAPLPATSDIRAAFRHLLDHLGYPIKKNSMEEDLLSLLSALGCPYKLTRSALKAPGTPHCWSPVLSVLYWLTVLSRVNDGLGASSSTTAPTSNGLLRHLTDSYYLFLTGEDDAAASLDEEYISKASAEADELKRSNQALENELEELTAKLSKQTAGPSRLRALEEKKEAFTGDLEKLEAVVTSWSTKIKEKEDSLAEIEKELEAKVTNGQLMMAENQDLVIKETEGLAELCNQALRK